MGRDAWLQSGDACRVGRAEPDVALELLTPATHAWGEHTIFRCGAVDVPTCRSMRSSLRRVLLDLRFEAEGRVRQAHSFGGMPLRGSANAWFACATQSVRWRDESLLAVLSDSSAG